MAAVMVVLYFFRTYKYGNFLLKWVCDFDTCDPLIKNVELDD